MSPELDRQRAIFVLGRIDEILSWEKAKEQERDVRFVELGEYLCEVRSKQHWRLEKLNSFDEFLQKRFPESRRKAYYLMAIHEILSRIPKQQLREVGWSKAVELIKVVRRDGEEFDCATWLHKAKELPKERFKGEVERHLTGKETESWEIIYFKLYKSQVPVVEKAIETAAFMLGTDRSRGYCLEMITAWVVVPSLTLFLCLGSTRAQSRTANYSFVVASGFLCDPGDSRSCPAVARSASGDSYEIAGAGTFDLANKSAKAAGTFNYKLANGDVLEKGVWTAIDFISFESYGIVPGALMQKGSAFDRPQLGARRLPLRSGLLPTGGLAIFRILLMQVSGTTKTAVLQVNCALGDVPRERSVEGIRITLEKSNSEYLEEASGPVIFLTLRPAPSTPAKVPEMETTPQKSGGAQEQCQNYRRS